jgi:unsaturated chondroitin disaccharide hydrolase
MNAHLTHPLFKSRWQPALDSLCQRVLEIRHACGERWPYHCDPATGEWDTTDDGDWCGGHWVECLRIVGELNGDKKLLDESAQRTERLRQYLERDDMFRAHRFYYSAARQFAWTRDPKFRTLALAGAWAVRSMALPSNGGMPIGTQVQVRSTSLFGRDKICVDNVHPNLILDWWAFKETGDEAFIAGARRHLDLTYEDFVLEDGSTIEFIDYDTVSGRRLKHYTLLGAHDESCWSRGQAWAVAGYLRAWEALRDARYLSIGNKLFDYWIANSGDDGIPPWDFKDPQLQRNRTTVPLDTSAAAIVVEQLARLSILEDLSADAMRATGRMEAMIDGLLSHLTPLNDTDHRPAGILLDGCFNQPKRYANRSELIWGTAYLLFALYYLKTGRVVE